MAEPHMRKLTALALCMLLPTREPELLKRTPQILVAVSSALLDSDYHSYE